MNGHRRSSPEPPWKAHGMAIAALVAATVVSAAVLPSIIPGLDREDDASNGQASVTEVTDVKDQVTIETTVEITSPTSPAATVSTEAAATTSGATDSTEAAPTTVPTSVSSTTVTTTEPVQQASLSPVPSVEDEAPQVVSIQTVPLVRDLVGEIDGRRVATDARGAIDLTPDDFDAEIEVIGVTAVPALSEVEFLQWSDGNTDQIRSAADMPGPVIPTRSAGQQPSDRRDRRVGATGEVHNVRVRPGRPVRRPRRRADIPDQPAGAPHRRIPDRRNHRVHRRRLAKASTPGPPSWPAQSLSGRSPAEQISSGT